MSDSCKTTEKLITSLTTEQEAMFPHYVEKWSAIGTNTKAIDPIITVNCINAVYANSDLPNPSCIGPINNQYEAAIVEFLLTKYATEEREFKSEKDIKKTVMSDLSDILAKEKSEHPALNMSNQIYGFQEYWLSYYDYFHNETILKLDRIQPLIALSKCCGWWTPLGKYAIFQHCPLAIHRDADGELHNETGPAVEYRGSEYANVWAVHGVRVPKRVINREYTWQDIDAETNAEVRRVMIDFYGTKEYILDSNAIELHSDDFGTLYMKEVAFGEAIMMVKVVNSTEEPDGSFKDYWLRVDPNAYGGVKTAKAAVASTWRNKDGSFVFENPNDYDCDIET